MDNRITITLTREEGEYLKQVLSDAPHQVHAMAIWNQLDRELTLPVVHYFHHYQSDTVPGHNFPRCVSDEDNEDGHYAYDPRDVTCKKCKSTKRWQTAMGKKHA